MGHTPPLHSPRRVIIAKDSARIIFPCYLRNLNKTVLCTNQSISCDTNSLQMPSPHERGRIKGRPRLLQEVIQTPLAHLPNKLILQRRTRLREQLREVLDGGLYQSHRYASVATTTDAPRK